MTQDSSEAASTRMVELARSHSIATQELIACWHLVVQGIRYKQLGTESLMELILHLRSGRDYIIEELGFEFLGQELRVSFLDEQHSCSPSDMLAELEKLNEACNTV